MNWYYAHGMMLVMWNIVVPCSWQYLGYWWKCLPCLHLINSTLMKENEVAVYFKPFQWHLVAKLINSLKWHLVSANFISHSLSILRKPCSSFRMNGEWGFPRVNRLQSSVLGFKRRSHKQHTWSHGCFTMSWVLPKVWNVGPGIFCVVCIMAEVVELTL